MFINEVISARIKSYYLFISLSSEMKWMEHKQLM